ncbi:MAG: ABC transporter permease, partial [Dehalococcoidia bacterium]
AVMLVSLVSPTLNNLIIALSIAIAPRASRVARGSTLAVKHEQYVEAAAAIGATHARIIRSYIFPNIFAPILVLFSVTMGAAITAEAALSFLGLGPPTLISWGRMLSAEGRQYMQVAWWMAIFPGLTIMITVLAFNMLGDALRDVLDPRLRGGR